MNKEIIEVEAEEIESFLPALNKLVNAEVARYDKYDLRMKELQEKYAHLEIKDVNDRSGYDEHKEALAELRGIRVGTDAERKNIKAPLIAAGKTIEAKAQWVIYGIEAIEAPLIERKEWFEKEKEAIKIAKEAAESKRLQTRVAQLKSLGADYDGEAMILGEASCDTGMLRGTNDEIYLAKILPRFQAEFDAREKIRIAAAEAEALVNAQKKKDEEAIKEREKQLKEAEAKLKAEQKKAEEEKVRLRKEMIATRQAKLFSIGLTHEYSTGNWTLGDVKVMSITIENFTQDAWDDFVSTLLPDIEIEKEKIQAAVKKETERIQQEAAEKALRQQREKDALAEEERIKKSHEAGDKVKYEDLVSYLKAAPAYEFKSKHFKAKNRIILDFLSDLK